MGRARGGRSWFRAPVRRFAALVVVACVAPACAVLPVDADVIGEASTSDPASSGAFLRFKDAVASSASASAGASSPGRPSDHGNNWAVLVQTSKYWFNYRHSTNVLSFYRIVKALGIPDSHILLLLAHDHACDPRNAYQAAVYNDMSMTTNVYGEDIQVDYRGSEVTSENFQRILTGRHAADVPRSKRMLSDADSNVLVYMTGHGGDEFLKFQDSEEIHSADIAAAFQQMHEKGRYKNLFFVIETCQANTLYNRFRSPNILALGAAKKGQNSLSRDSSPEVGVSLIDRFTYEVLNFFHYHAKMDVRSNKTVGDLGRELTFQRLHSHIGYRTDLYHTNPDDVKVTEFFAAVQQGIRVTQGAYPLAAQPAAATKGPASSG